MKVEDFFDRIYAINLPERVDRRKGIEKELKAIGLDFSCPDVNLFSAVRPSDPLAFPNIGVLGCYLSHLEILREARDNNFQNILVMEDDLAISRQFSVVEKSLISQLRELDYGIVFLGYSPYNGLEYSDYYTEESREQISGDSISFQKSKYPVKGTHFYAVNHRIYDDLIAFLEELLEKRTKNISIQTKPLLGDLDGAYIDTAYYLFFERQHEIDYLIASSSLGWQRSSKSDITPSRLEKLSFLKPLMFLIEIAREIKNQLKKLGEKVS